MPVGGALDNRVYSNWIDLNETRPFIQPMSVLGQNEKWLFESLARREQPERVAESVIAVLGERAPKSVIAAAKPVVTGSLFKRFGWSSMSNKFRDVAPADDQIAKAVELADLFLNQKIQAPSQNGDAVAKELSGLIHRDDGASNFFSDRLNGEQRAAAGMALSRRRYNKLFRLAGRLEAKNTQVKKEAKKRDLTLVGKSMLACDIVAEDLANKPFTACFIAYYTARSKLRSEFTIIGQQKPFDQLSAALLDACAKHESANWLAVARVFPRDDVLARLNDEQKGMLLGRWYGILVETAGLLEAAFEHSGIDLETMVVKRGNDSTTWNVFAGAWNRARDHWMALVSALGMSQIFEALLPSKCLRLMAGDVAAWHASIGSGLHPDTKIWREVPKPWLVLRGQAICTRSMIEQACAKHGVLPQKSGWSAPRPRNHVSAFRPTPELVHGVSVHNPYLAGMLKRMGAYSGKTFKPEIVAKLVNDLDSL